MALTLLPTRLDGPKLLAPDVFADDRGFFAETYRREWLAEHGVESDSSRTTTLARRAASFARSIFSARPAAASSAPRARADPGTSWSTCGRTPRPLPRGRRMSSRDENMHQLWIPPGFGHGFCVPRDVADVLYKAGSLLQRGRRARRRLGRPGRGDRVAASGRRDRGVRARRGGAAAGLTGAASWASARRGFERPRAPSRPRRARRPSSAASRRRLAAERRGGATGAGTPAAAAA